jgi:formylglycine-generating enzyme required for sulfatase activity
LEALNGDLEKLNGDFLTLGDLIGAADDKVKDWTKSTKASVQLPELIGSEDYRDFPLAAAKRRMITIDERFAEVLKKIDAPYFLSVSATRELYNIYFDARETQNWDVLEPLIEALEKILPSDPVSTQQFIGYWTENKDRWVKKKEEPRPERPLELPVPGKPFQIPSLGLEFVWIPAGSFWMGSPSTETGRGSDEKRHYVQISQGFWMAKYEMTIESFTHFVEETGHVTEAEKNDEGLRGWNGKEFIFLKGENWRNTLNAGPTYPVVGVSWNDAVAYCEWLNEKQKRLGRLPAGYAFQLPTEAQWEYACRAGSTGPVYIEGEWEILGKNNAPLLDEISWYGGNSGVEYRPAFNSKDWPEKQYNHVAAGTHPVGQKQPNDFGLNDMLGNVWEWTADIYGAYPDSSYQQPLLDPVGPASGSYRVLRGGSWIDDALICRSAFRDRLTPSDRGSIIGFRLSLRSASFR